MAQPGPTDRRPELKQLIRPADLNRCLRPFLEWGCDGVMLFDLAGMPHGGASVDEGPLSSWEQLPAEAQCLAGQLGRFGLGDHVFEVRPAYAGADRVGTLVCSAAAVGAQGPAAQGLCRLADALAGVLGQMLQAGFATWVTSELHLAASEDSYIALQQQNTELQRAVQHLRELDKLKSNFLATVSHELRTPLTSVIGFSEMLLDGIGGTLSPEQRNYVETILSRGEELLTLISQILEMSRLEVGAIRLALQSYDAAALVNRAISGLELEAARADVTLRTELVLGSLPPVLADADKVHRVLTNLLSNAVKFTDAGGRVTVTATPAPIRRPFAEETLFGEEDANALRITVRDTGVGIAADQLERIFEAFYQVDAGPTRAHGGAGLGLSIVKNLVVAHGGDAWAESTPGEGAVLSFTLPIATEAPKPVPGE